MIDWKKDAVQRLVATDAIQSGPNARADVEAGEGFEDLVRSVQDHGILVPLIVRPWVKVTGHGADVPGGEYFQVVAGQRRLAAARKVGLAEVPAVIASLDDKTALAVAAMENLQREDLTTLEEAEAYRQLRDVVGLKVKDIAARTGMPLARVNGVLQVLLLPDDLRTQVGDAFPLADLKWVFKVPEAAENGRAEMFRSVANGWGGKDAFFRLIAVLDPERIRFPLEAKPPCLDCPKARRYQVPPKETDRWNWKGETGKGWPEIPCCFDRECREQKEARARGGGRRAATRRLPTMVKNKVRGLSEELGEDFVTNGLLEFKKFRQARKGQYGSIDLLPRWDRDKAAFKRGATWPAEFLYGVTSADPEKAALQDLCEMCPYHRALVDGFVNHQDQARVVVRSGCTRPAQRAKELKKIRAELDGSMDAARASARRRFWTKDLPGLTKKAGGAVVADALLRRLNRWGVGNAGPIVEGLLAGDEKAIALKDKTGIWSDDDLATFRGLVEKKARDLYSRDPRKLVVLFALPELSDHVHNLEGLAAIAAGRLELVGKDIDPHRLEAIAKGTVAVVKPLIDVATADECRILVSRISDQKTKVAAVERRLGKLNKTPKGDDR